VAWDFSICGGLQRALADALRIIVRRRLQSKSETPDAFFEAYFPKPAFFEVRQINKDSVSRLSKVIRQALGEVESVLPRMAYELHFERRRPSR
jgi:hypothetical protein